MTTDMGDGSGIGEPREAGMNILLFVVTATVYWFMWQYVAFKELINQRKLNVKLGLPIFALLAPLWVAGLTFWTLHLILDKSADKVMGFITISPWYFAGVALLLAYFLLQARFSIMLNQILREANQSFGDDRTPPNFLAGFYGWLFCAFWVPGVGILTTMFACVMWVVWTYNAQEALNRYWLGHVSLPQEVRPGLKAPG